MNVYSHDTGPLGLCFSNKKEYKFNDFITLLISIFNPKQRMRKLQVKKLPQCQKCRNWVLLSLAQIHNRYQLGTKHYHLLQKLWRGHVQCTQITMLRVSIMHRSSATLPETAGLIRMYCIITNYKCSAEWLLIAISKLKEETMVCCPLPLPLLRFTSSIKNNLLMPLLGR